MTDASLPKHLETIAQDIENFVEINTPRLFDLCSDLVAARSVNPPGRTVEAAAIVEAFLGENGIVCETLANENTKPNIISQATGHSTGRHLILNGHLDTVSPGREEDWTVPPYQTTQSDEKIFGLGMGNMKAGVAALSLAFVWLSRNPQEWPGQISYTAVADETVFGPDGAGWLLAHQPGFRGDAVICGEGPGDMNLAIAEKGLGWVELTATALSGQGMLSTPASSAVTRLVEAISQIDQWNTIQVTPPDELKMLKPHAGDHGFRLSVNTGTIEGGHFISQVATQAKAEIDFRLPPGMSREDLDTRLERVCAEIEGLSFRHIKGWDPNWTAPGAAVCTAVAEAASRIRPVPPQPVVRLPASDASRWRAMGVPAVCFGPQPLLASGVDDFAFAGDIADCAKIYALAAVRYLDATA